MIDIKHLTKTFGTQTVLYDISEHIAPGEKVVIIGHFIGLLFGHQACANRGECNILADGHVGKQVEMLKHHAHFLSNSVDVFLWIRNSFAVEHDRAGAGLLHQV